MFGSFKFSVYFFLLLSLYSCTERKSRKLHQKENHSSDSIPKAKSFPLLASSFIDTIQQPDSSTTYLKTIESICRSMIQDQLDANRVESVSLYFEDLNSGRTFSIHPDITYAPASLLKLSVLLAYLKIEENQPDIRFREIPVYIVSDMQTNSDADENTPVTYSSNRGYSVDELCKNMISHSDNSATQSLLMYLDANYPGLLENLEKELEASIPANASNNENIIKAGHFAGMLRALYYGNYLRPDLAQRALEILCSSRYMQGFRKNIPSNTPIAHKFGIRYPREDHPEDFTQLHETGIIYLNKRPFILSVMTKGNGIPEQRKVIQEISGTLYQHLTQH